MRVLHAGAGGGALPDFLRGEEVRLDIDPATGPDIVASMVDVGDIGPFDVVYCNHALEHLYPHEVGRALREFHRVLKDNGFALVFVPDLEDVKATEEVLYESPDGPITGLDLIYGKRDRIASMPHMAHHTGFTAATLAQAFREAGFVRVETKRIGPCFNLMGVGIK